MYFKWIKTSISTIYIIIYCEDQLIKVINFTCMTAEKALSKIQWVCWKSFIFEWTSSSSVPIQGTLTPCLDKTWYLKLMFMEIFEPKKSKVQKKKILCIKSEIFVFLHISAFRILTFSPALAESSAAQTFYCSLTASLLNFF